MTSNEPERQEEPTATEKNAITLKQTIRFAVDQYFFHLDGQDPINLYQLVLSEVEKPLLERVMHHTDGNQTRAAEALGLNRGTLRKKLRQYSIS